MDTDIIWLPDQLFRYLERSSPAMREDMMRRLIDNRIEVAFELYPDNENFTNNVLNYYRSGLNKMFEGHKTVHEVSAWLAQNPKVNNFVKHPVTGDTIWHKYFRYTNVLLPPVYDRIPKSIMDTFGSSKDPILALENFFGCSVFKLLKDDRERLANLNKPPPQPLAVFRWLTPEKDEQK